MRRGLDAVAVNIVVCLVYWSGNVQQLQFNTFFLIPSYIELVQHFERYQTSMFLFCFLRIAYSRFAAME
jgi:hypothetical protein